MKFIILVLYDCQLVMGRYTENIEPISNIKKTDSNTEKSVRYIFIFISLIGSINL